MRVSRGRGKKYQNRNALAVTVCNAITATITCSSESTDGTFSVVCGQKNQRLYHVCWSLIFLVVINLVLFAACHCDLNLIAEIYIDRTRYDLFKIPLKMVL